MYDRQILDILNAQESAIRSQLSKGGDKSRRRFLAHVLKEVQKSREAIVESNMGGR